MSYLSKTIKTILAVFLVYIITFMLVDIFAPNASMSRVLGLPSVIWYLSFLNYGLVIVLASVFAWVVVPKLVDRHIDGDIKKSKEASV